MKSFPSCLPHCKSWFGLVWLLFFWLYYCFRRRRKPTIREKKERTEPLWTLLFLNESLMNTPSISSTSIFIAGSLKNGLLLFWNRIRLSDNQAYLSLMIELLANWENLRTCYLYAEHSIKWQQGCTVAFLCSFPSWLIKLGHTY